MKLLKSEVKKNGFNYRLVERNDFKAIYSQNEGSKILAFEVFRIKKQKATSAKCDGQWVYFEAKEVFPNNESFGRTAWSFKKLSEAKKKYSEITPPKSRKRRG